jgi:hypothetical protein
MIDTVTPFLRPMLSAAILLNHSATVRVYIVYILNGKSTNLQRTHSNFGGIMLLSTTVGEFAMEIMRQELQLDSHGEAMDKLNRYARMFSSRGCARTNLSQAKCRTLQSSVIR